MENPNDSNAPVILRLKLDCCRACPNKLKKELHKINGVQKVKVYQKLNLAVVTGNVDPKILIDTIRSLLKEATLGCVEDLKQCNNKNFHSDDDHYAENNHDGIASREEICHQKEYNTVGGKDKCPQQRTEKKGKKCYCKGDPNYNKKRSDGDDHVVENFEEIRFEKFDEDICEEPYCGIHRRKHSGVPAVDDRAPMYWDHQPPGGPGGAYFPAGRNPQGPQPPWIRELPHLSFPPYGYPSSSSMPPPRYGGRSRRPPFRYDYYGDYHGNRGCATM